MSKVIDCQKFIILQKNLFSYNICVKKIQKWFRMSVLFIASYILPYVTGGVATAFGAQPEDHNEEENKTNLRTNEKN